MEAQVMRVAFEARFHEAEERVARLEREKSEESAAKRAAEEALAASRHELEEVRDTAEKRASALRKEAARSEELREEGRELREGLSKARIELARREHAQSQMQDETRTLASRLAEEGARTEREMERAATAERHTRELQVQLSAVKAELLSARSTAATGAAGEAASAAAAEASRRASIAEEKAAREEERSRQFERENDRLSRQLREARQELAEQRELWAKEEAAMRALHRALEARVQEAEAGRKDAVAAAEAAQEQLTQAEEAWGRAAQQLRERVAEYEKPKPKEAEKTDQPAATEPALGGLASRLTGELEAKTRQLHAYKVENHKLNSSLQEIVREIEAKAPSIQNMRREWEEATRDRERMANQLRKALESHSDMEGVVLEMRTRERALQQHVQDLGLQISSLLNNQVQRLAENDTSGVAHLIRFKDVEELQRQNGLLLLRVREEEERGAAKAEAAELRVTEMHRQELQELREARKQQEELAERAVRQKDVYKNLLAKLAQQQQQQQGEFSTAISSSSSLSIAEQCAACKDWKIQRTQLESQVASLDSQVATFRGKAERANAELEWAQGRVAQLERERAAWTTERERLERSVIQMTDRLNAAEDRVSTANRRAEEAREAREELRARFAKAAEMTDRLTVEAEVAKGLHREGEEERASLRRAVERMSLSCGAAEEGKKNAELELLRVREEKEVLRAQIAECQSAELLARENGRLELEKERERSRQERREKKEATTSVAEKEVANRLPFGGDELRARVAELEEQLAAERESIANWRSVAQESEHISETFGQQMAQLQAACNTQIANASATIAELQSAVKRGEEEANDLRNAVRASARAAREAREELRKTAEAEMRVQMLAESSAASLADSEKRLSEAQMRVGELLGQVAGLREALRVSEVERQKAESLANGLQSVRDMREAETREAVERERSKNGDLEKRLAAVQHTCSALQLAIDSGASGSGSSGSVAEVSGMMRREKEVLEARCEMLELQCRRLEERLASERRAEEDRIRSHASAASSLLSPATVRLTQEEHEGLLRRVAEAEMARESREMIRQNLEAAVRENEHLRQRAVAAERSRGPSEEAVEEAREGKRQAEARAELFRAECENLRSRVAQMTEKYSAVDPEALRSARAEAAQFRQTLAEKEREIASFAESARAAAEASNASHAQKMKELIGKFKSLKADLDQCRSDLAAARELAEQLKVGLSEAAARNAQLSAELVAALASKAPAPEAAASGGPEVSSGGPPAAIPPEVEAELAELRKRETALKQLGVAFKSLRMKHNALTEECAKLREQLAKQHPHPAPEAPEVPEAASAPEAAAAAAPEAAAPEVTPEAATPPPEVLEKDKEKESPKTKRLRRFTGVVRDGSTGREDGSGTSARTSVIAGFAKHKRSRGQQVESVIDLDEQQEADEHEAEAGKKKKTTGEATE